MSINLSKDKIKVDAVIPYTYSSMNSVRSVLKHPLIILKYGREKYYITGRKLLWALLDRTFGPRYDRTEVLDSLYNGPINDFKNWLSTNIKQMKDDSIILGLCTREEFEKEYRLSPVFCVDGVCTTAHNIVGNITVPTEEAHLLHILAVLKDYDVPMNYDGISNRVQYAQKGVAVVHEFSEDKHEKVTMRMRITVTEKSTATIEAWVEGDEWEASPFSELKYAYEFDPRYFGPTLKRYYEELSLASAACSKNVNIAKASWLRMKDKIERRKKEDGQMGRQQLMSYRSGTIDTIMGDE